MDPDNCNRLPFTVIDYNYENFNPRASKMVRNLFQTIVIDYYSFVIDYNYEKHNNRSDTEQTHYLEAWVSYNYLKLMSSLILLSINFKT